MNQYKNSGLPIVPLYYSVPLLAICVVAFAILVFVFNIGVPSVLFNPPPNAVNVTSCGTLGQNDTYYYLNTSLSFAAVNCLIITGNNTVLDGENRQNLTGSNALDASAVLVFGNNVTVKGLNISFAYNGIKVQSTSNVTVTFNLINYSNYSAVYVNSSSGVNVFQNLLLYPSWAGVYFEGASFSTAQQNYIYGRELVGGSSFGGIGLSASSSTNVSNNYVQYTALAFGTQWSNNNLFAYNVAERPSINGFFMWLSFGPRNILQHNRVINSSASAIYLDNVTDILLFNDSAVNTSSSSYDLETNATVNMEITDSYFARYSFNNSLLKFRNTGNARLNFTQPATLSGVNLSADVRLGFDYVEVNSSLRPGLNKSALVTLEGLATNFVNATIFRNGVSCPQNVCTALNSLTAGTVIFNVSSWTNYTVGSGAPSGPTININEPDNNDVYLQNSFPVLFDVDLSQNGTVWFTLNNGTTNTTMNTTNNIDFTYVQIVLPAANYTFRAYATFNASSQIYMAYVNFTVLNTSIILPIPGNQTNNSANSSFPPFLPPNTTIHLNNTNSSNFPGSESSVEFKYIAYWLIVTVLAIAIVILILLIVKYFRTRETQRSTIPGSIVSQLR